VSVVVDHEVVDGLDGGQVLGGLPLLVPPEHRAPGLYHHRGEEPQPGVLADAVALVPRAVHENDGLEGEYTSSSSSSYNTTTSSLPAPLHYGGEGGGGGAGEDQEGGGGGVGGDGGVRVQRHHIWGEHRRVHRGALTRHLGRWCGGQVVRWRGVECWLYQVGVVGSEWLGGKVR